MLENLRKFEKNAQTCTNLQSRRKILCKKIGTAQAYDNNYFCFCMRHVIRSHYRRDGIFIYLFIRLTATIKYHAVMTLQICVQT